MGLRSGDCVGHCRRVNPWFLNHFWISFAGVFRVIVLLIYDVLRRFAVMGEAFFLEVHHPISG